MLISEPTVIWSGSGYHIYLVLDAFVLEREDAFNNTKFGSNPSQKFLRYAEWFLSNGKCDPQHNKTVSLRNCMLGSLDLLTRRIIRIVRVIQRWNGYRPNIKLLLEDFYVYLSSQRLAELEENRSRNLAKVELRRQLPKGSSNIHWIERLLQTPISDYRKVAIWRIFAPYLLNICGLSQDEAHSIIHDWLEECGKLRRLDFTPSYKIKGALNSSRDFLPVSCHKLEVENAEFYSLLQDNGVLTKWPL